MKGCPSLSPREFRLALRALKGRYRWRDRAMLILGVRTGLRISELLSIRVGQIWDGTAVRPRVYVNRQDSKCKLAGSSIIIHPQAAAALAKWVHHRGAVSPDDWLFPSQRCPTRALGRQAAWLILPKAFLTAGVSGMAGSHVMRKTYAQNLNRVLNGNIFLLSKAMRHSSPLSTLAYLSYRQEEIDRAIFRA